MRHSQLLVLVPTLLFASLAEAGGIRWSEQTGLEANLARAKEQSRVVFLALNMDGERANEEMLREHYRDARLGKLSEHTINLFCSCSGESKVPGVSAATQQRNDIDVRGKVLKAGPDEWVVAPQHLWLSPDGQILLAVPYRITKGELEWAFVEAIRKVDAGFAWELSEAARAPRRLRLDGQAARGSKDEAPPSPEEVAKVLEELRKSRRGWQRAREDLDTILRSDDPKAIALAEQFLRGVPDERKVQTLTTIGQRSPAPWADIVEPYLDAKSPELRRAAVIALGEIANAKSVRALGKALRAPREEPGIRGQILQALAKIEPGNKTLLRELDKALGPKSEETLRVHAVCAVGRLEDRVAVERHLAQALGDPAPLVRKAAILQIASRRDEKLLPLLQAAMAKETEADCRELATAAEKASQGGSLEPFAGLEKELAQL